MEIQNKDVFCMCGVGIVMMGYGEDLGSWRACKLASTNNLKFNNYSRQLKRSQGDKRICTIQYQNNEQKCKHTNTHPVRLNCVELKYN